MIHSTVARPQRRGKIERLFGTLNTELLPDLPSHLNEGKPTTPPKLSLSELDTETYNTRAHSETGVAPITAWCGKGWLPRMPESLETLDELLVMLATPRLVRRDGVHFQGLRFMSPTLTKMANARSGRFIELADTVRKHRYIGICFGPAGVGKTVSAHRFARWNQTGELLETWGPRDPSDAIAYDALNRSKAVFYTPAFSGPNL